jgi:hypothetical protein
MNLRLRHALLIATLWPVMLLSSWVVDPWLSSAGSGPTVAQLAAGPSSIASREAAVVSSRRVASLGAATSTDADALRASPPTGPAWRTSCVAL